MMSYALRVVVPEGSLPESVKPMRIENTGAASTPRMTVATIP